MKTHHEIAQAYYLRVKDKKPRTIICQALRSCYNANGDYFVPSMLSWWR